MNTQNKGSAGRKRGSPHYTA